MLRTFGPFGGAQHNCHFFGGRSDGLHSGHQTYALYYYARGMSCVVDWAPQLAPPVRNVHMWPYAPAVVVAVGALIVAAGSDLGGRYQSRTIAFSRKSDVAHIEPRPRGIRFHRVAGVPLDQRKGISADACACCCSCGFCSGL